VNLVRRNCRLFQQNRAKADDILDAAALALAAGEFDSSRVLPGGRAEKDARGLKMQIWH
jgi:predicted RNase H-like nuclease